MATQRQLRLQELLKHEVGGIIKALEDPLIGLATVTDAEVSPDLRHARIYVSVYSPEGQAEATMRGLRRAAKHVRGELARRLQLKYTPEIRFCFDESVERAARIEALFRQIAGERADETAPDS